MKTMIKEHCLATCFVMVFFLLISYNNFTAHLDFDSAFNLNVVKNFVQKGIYGTSVYLVDGQKYYWFDPWISTGPSVLLPISLFVFLTKSLFIVPRFVMNLIFYVFIYLLSLLIWKLNKKIDLHKIMGINIALVLIHTYYFDKILNLTFYLHGEITGYVYILIALLGLLSSNPLVVGLFLGFTLLTKMQFVFLCGPLFLGSIYYFRKNLNKLITLIISFIIPLFLYLIALLLAFGKGIRNYYGDFKGVAIMQHANPTLSQIRETSQHIIRLILDYPVFFTLATISIILIAIKFKKFKQNEKIIAVSFIAFLFYFVLIWRSNSPGHLYMPKFICFVWCSYNFINLFSIKIQRYISNAIIVTSFLLIPSLLVPGKYLQQQQDAAKYLKSKYPNSTFYNIGWWKSPELQIFMNRDVIRLDKINLTLCKKDCYLLVSRNQVQLDPESIKDAMRYKLIEKKDYFSLYKIK
jgi:hypothetical protein